MRWPWVSRLAYDCVCSERDILRRQVESMGDQLVRMKRVEMGMREVTPVAKVEKVEPPKKIEVPPEVRRLYAGRCASKAFEDELERQAISLYVNNTPWVEVARVLELQLGPPPEGVRA